MISTHEPYGPFEVGRGARVNGRVLVASDDGDETGMDISAARWAIYLRAYDDRAATRLVINRSIAKSSNAATGYYLEDVPAWTTPYPNGLRWEEVRVDLLVADSNTVSGQNELVLRRWQQPILDAPQLPPA